jgi:hypothetical protein
MEGRLERGGRRRSRKIENSRKGDERMGIKDGRKK